MLPRRLLRVCPLVLCLGLACLGLTLETSEASTASPLRIGMVKTFFTDVPKAVADFVTDPFGQVMKEATGLDGNLAVGGDPFDVAGKLNDGTLHLGVFHGHEFAWAQQKHPQLRPLMIAVNKHKHVRAYLITRKDSDAECFADFRGKDVSIPRRTKEHCRIFIERECNGCGQCGVKEFFGKIVPTINVETALDDVCGGKVSGCVLDTLGLEFYRELKPGLFNKLKIVRESEVFPAAVIAYRQGTLDEATQNRLRDGLRIAHTLELGREMMNLWKVQSFDHVPGDYQQSLADILKAYPVPETAAKLSRR